MQTCMHAVHRHAWLCSQVCHIYTYIHTYVHAAAVENGNTLSEYYHSGAYGLQVNPTRWSCCDNKLRDVRGCCTVVTPSVTTMPSHGMTCSNDTVIFSEEEFSDDEDFPFPSRSYDLGQSASLLSEDNPTP